MGCRAYAVIGLKVDPTSITFPKLVRECSCVVPDLGNYCSNCGKPLKRTISENILAGKEIPLTIPDFKHSEDLHYITQLDIYGICINDSNFITVQNIKIVKDAIISELIKHKMSYIFDEKKFGVTVYLSC